jgi:hypothetical protein
MFWIYNVVASFLTVVLSEPRAGVYRFVASLLGGEAPVWQWLHVISSLVTSALVITGFIAFRPASHRDRLIAAAGIALLVLGSGLGFLYTRDRIGLFAGVGYAMLVYVAFAMLFERRSPVEAGRVASPLARYGVMAAVTVVVVMWTVRVGEAYTSLRDTAWDYHLEWTDRYAALGGAMREQTPLLLSLRAAALATTPADPQQDPAWTYALFERQFSPSGHATATADAAADNAVTPLSLPFDIRWKADVDDATRQQLEAELGLTDGQHVARDPRGRTWEYRMRTPTRDRVRAVVVHAAVEDTGRIDVQRFEVVQ